MHISLYRKYRPSKFADIVGQPNIVSALERSLSNAKASQAYLFSGPRGCGKTTAARLVAKRLNCASPVGAEPCGVCASCVALAGGGHLDIIEIDGASNRGIDEIRELKNQVALAPFESKYKVFIIDEVHMLTEPAFNALLKTLEEPPAGVYFILATTEPHKVPVTIRSRCVHLPFGRISADSAVRRLEDVCRQEGVGFEEQALWEIARQADGALRDALSMLEQVMALDGDKLTVVSLAALLGGSGREDLQRWLVCFREDRGSAFARMAELTKKGANLERLIEGFFVLFRDLLLCRTYGDKITEAIDASAQEREFLIKEAPNWDIKFLEQIMNYLSDILPRARYGMRADVFTGLIFQKFMSLTRKEEITQAPKIEKKVEIKKIEPKETKTEIPTLMPKFIDIIAKIDILTAWAATYLIVTKTDDGINIALEESEDKSIKYAKTALYRGRARAAIKEAAQQVWQEECIVLLEPENIAETANQNIFAEAEKKTKKPPQQYLRSQAAEADKTDGTSKAGKFAAVEAAKKWLDADVLLIKERTPSGLDDEIYE